MIYLDNSATTRVLPETAKAVYAAMTDDYYNPASGYSPAVRVERTVEACRRRLAAALGHQADEIYYTSGGTESNNMAIFGTLAGVRGKCRAVTCVAEHASVYEVFERLKTRPDTEVAYVGTNADGTVKLDELAAALNTETALVSLMHVNNETGAVNDIGTCYSLVRRLSPAAAFHVDGVQAFCKLPFSSVPCDLYSVSAHKFHAPKGVGALYVRAGLRFAGGQIGGGQEKNLRSGTTNVPGVVGMDASLTAYRGNHAAWMQSMRACKERLAENLLRIEDAVVNGPAVGQGAGHILNISFPGVRGETLLNALSEREICVSTGSACSTRKKGKNRVLNAIGVTGARQEGAIRFSFCPFNTLAEMDVVSGHIEELVAFFRRYQRR